MRGREKVTWWTDWSSDLEGRTLGRKRRDIGKRRRTFGQAVKREFAQFTKERRVKREQGVQNKMTIPSKGGDRRGKED